MYAEAAEALPAGIVAGPEAVAAIVLALIENVYATGVVFRVDGGATIA